MTTAQPNNNIQIEHWLSLNYSVEQVVSELQTRNLNAEAIEHYLKGYKKQRSSKQ